MPRLNVFVFILLLVTLLPSVSFACSCKERTDSELYKNAKAVFLAEVTLTEIEKDESENSLGDMVIAKFRVIESFKPGSAEITEVRDLSFGFGNCSIGLTSGMEYVFYVSNDKGKFTNYVGMCTGSRPVNLQADEANELLDRIRKLGSTK